MNKILLVAFLLIINRSFYGHVVYKLLIFRIIHALDKEKSYYSKILLFPDLYSFGKLSTSSNCSKVVPRFYNNSFITEFPPLLKLLNKEAKFIIINCPLDALFIFENL